MSVMHRGSNHGIFCNAETLKLDVEWLYASWLLLLMQLTTEVMQLYSDDDEVEKAFSGENVKMKLKNVEEEVSDEFAAFHLHHSDFVPFVTCQSCLYVFGYMYSFLIFVL